MKSVWLNETALSVIDGMFWGCVGESYVDDDDLPTWNQIRKAMGAPLIVHDPCHGYLPEDDPRVGQPRRHGTPPTYSPSFQGLVNACEGVTTTTSSRTPTEEQWGKAGM